MTDLIQPTSRSEAYLYNMATGEGTIPQFQVNRKEVYYKAIIDRLEGIAYLTEAPTADNPNGLKIVVLDENPETKYDGYLYIITE